MIYYPIVRRYGNEVYDIREFVNPNAYAVFEVLKNVYDDDKIQFIQNSWGWVIRNINYPYFTEEITNFFDRHYMEGYILKSNTIKVAKRAFINGAITGIARAILTGSINLSIATVAKDFVIGNAVYSAVTALVNNQESQYTPQFSYEQFDFWNFPAETLRDMTGDCEDTAILLCSILRTKLSEDEIFVTVGFFENIGHAWVTYFDSAGNPIVLETTSDDLVKVPESTAEQPPYYPVFRFNDKKVITLKNETYTSASADNELKKMKKLSKYYVLKNT